MIFIPHIVVVFSIISIWSVKNKSIQIPSANFQIVVKTSQQNYCTITSYLNQAISGLSTTNLLNNTEISEHLKMKHMLMMSLLYYQFEK